MVTPMTIDSGIRPTVRQWRSPSRPHHRSAVLRRLCDQSVCDAAHPDAKDRCSRRCTRASSLQAYVGDTLCDALAVQQTCDPAEFSSVGDRNEAMTTSLHPTAGSLESGKPKTKNVSPMHQAGSKLSVDNDLRPCHGPPANSILAMLHVIGRRLLHERCYRDGHLRRLDCGGLRVIDSSRNRSLGDGLPATRT